MREGSTGFVRSGVSHAGVTGLTGVIGPGSDLVTLCAGVQQALLDGELEQVVIFVSHWLTAARAKSGVVCWGLKH